jgi:nucleoside-diphosphate-sugar epimerase
MRKLFITGGPGFIGSAFIRLAISLYEERGGAYRGYYVRQYTIEENLS